MLLSMFNKGKSRSKGDSRISRLVSRLFYTDLGQIMISLVFGLAIAFMFQKVCKDKKCFIIEAPPMEELNKYVYRIGNDCYKYTPRIVACVENTETI